MIYTDNLQLPILEDTDNFSQIFSQGNTISEKLETFGSTQKNKNDTYDASKVKVDKVEKDLIDFKALYNQSSKDLWDKVIQLEKDAVNTNILIDGENLKCKTYTAKIVVSSENITTTKKFSYCDLEPDEEGRKRRIAFVDENCSTSLNLTELLGLNLADRNNILILGVTTYNKDQQLPWNGKKEYPAMNISSFGGIKIPNSTDTNLYLYLSGETTDIDIQRDGGMTGGGWQPPVNPYASSGELIVMLRYAVLA